MEENKKYTCLAEYFRDHPEDEAGYYDDMAEQANYDQLVEQPEDYDLCISSR